MRIEKLKNFATKAQRHKEKIKEKDKRKKIHRRDRGDRRESRCEIGIQAKIKEYLIADFADDADLKKKNCAQSLI